MGSLSKPRCDEDLLAETTKVHDNSLEEQQSEKTISRLDRDCRQSEPTFLKHKISSDQFTKSLAKLNLMKKVITDLFMVHIRSSIIEG